MKLRAIITLTQQIEIPDTEFDLAFDQGLEDGLPETTKQTRARTEIEVVRAKLQELLGYDLARFGFEVHTLELVNPEAHIHEVLELGNE